MAVYNFIERLKGIKADFKEKFGLSSDDFSDYPDDILATCPRLNPPSLTISGSTVTVVDALNGGHSSSYELYVDDVLAYQSASGVFDLSGLAVGSYTIFAKAKGAGFKTSYQSVDYFFNVYSVTCALTSITSTAPVKVAGGQDLSATLTVTSGYLPRDISVTVGGQNANFSYDCYSGQLCIYAVSGAVVITASASAYPLLDRPEPYFINNSIKWQGVTGAESYSVYNGDTLVGTTATNELYLSGLLQGYTQYSLQVIATGTGYQNSLPSDSVQVYVEDCKVFGVSGLQQGGSITRTDDAVGMNYLIRTSTGEIVSDFDDEFPFNEIEVVEKSGNKFVKFPKMYFRVATNANGVLTSVAVSKRPKGEGNWFEVGEFYYGAYLGSVVNGKLNSASGSAISSRSLDSFRNSAVANGSGYFVLDVYHRTVLMFLWLIEFCSKGNNVPYGRNKDSGGTYSCGATDSLTTPSGYSLENGQLRYHYIEDFNGSYFEYTDGVISKNGVLYVSSNPADYSNNGYHYTQFPYVYTGGGNVKCAEMSWSDELPFLVHCTKGSNTNPYYAPVTDYTAFTALNLYFYKSCNTGIYSYGGIFSYIGGSTTDTTAMARLMYKENL